MHYVICDLSIPFTMCHMWPLMKWHTYPMSKWLMDLHEILLDLNFNQLKRINRRSKKEQKKNSLICSLAHLSRPHSLLCLPHSHKHNSRRHPIRRHPLRAKPWPHHRYLSLPLSPCFSLAISSFTTTSIAVSSTTTRTTFFFLSTGLKIINPNPKITRYLISIKF